MTVIENPTVVTIPCASRDITLTRLENRLSNESMAALMHAGWIIISTWIDDVRPNTTGSACTLVSGVSFRLARGKERMIATADIIVDMPGGVIPNIDADEPGSEVKLVPSVSNEAWLTRLVSIAGFGTASGGGPGAISAVDPVTFSIVGLDIEMSTFARGGNMPLPHDDLISITISNGGWLDDSNEDVCYCIYTFGYHNPDEIVDGRRPTFIKAGTSANAVAKAYEILTVLSPDFVNIHNGFGFDLNVMATHSALADGLTYMFEERRLGNTGSATYLRLPNGTSFVDSMYDIDKYLRKDWPSISLATVARVLDLPPKLDADEMSVERSESYNVTEMLRYNIRDSDLHAWVIKQMRTCERYFMLAGTSRSTIWDAIAGNTGNMMFCYQQSLAMSQGACLDLSRSVGVDEREFEGGFVLEPKPGCYKGVVVIDGNSLYGSIMSKLGIFIDRCASSDSPLGLAHKLDRDLDAELHLELERVEEDDVIEYADLILMRSKDTYMCVKKGRQTMLTVIIDDLINKRKIAKMNKQEDRSWAYKLLLVSVYGAMGSRHGVLSSKTCAEITTYAARYYLKSMIEATRWCGYEVLYGDTDSIFVWVKGSSQVSCSIAATKVKKAINEVMSETVFSGVGADVKGNYRSIVISAKKKYEAVNWDGTLDTKGLAMVKKDTPPIVRYSLARVMTVLNSEDEDEIKVEKLIRLVGKIMSSLQSGELPISAQVTEVKVNGQPHLSYVDGNMKKRKILIGIGLKPSDVNKKWVRPQDRPARSTPCSLRGGHEQRPRSSSSPTSRGGGCAWSRSSTGATIAF